jgi:hypothetical protein
MTAVARWCAAGALALTTLATTACENAQPTAVSRAGLQASVTEVSNTYASGSALVTAWDPIFPSSAYPNWTVQACGPTPLVGLGANWQNPHPATAFPIGTHPWEFIAPYNFSANWINAWSNISSQGPGGQNWTKYSTPVEGSGDFVVQFLADNCSWIYIDNTLIGVQDANWGTNGTGRYPLTLNGAHTLTFIIFDGGGAAGGKFRLETRQSFIDNGGDPGSLPDPTDATPPVVTPSVSGTLGNNGWYTSDVAVSWTVTDGESAVSAMTGCGPTTVTGDTGGAGFTCSATSAGGTASASVSVTRDATAPSIAFTGNAGSYTVDQQVAITCSATDAMSGLAASTCPTATGDAYTFGLGAHALAATATDLAGNAASASTTFTVSVTSGTLCTLVRRWVTKAGVAQSMCQQLANSAYGAFRNHVDSQRDKSVTSPRADILIALSRGL